MNTFGISLEKALEICLNDFPNNKNVKKIFKIISHY